MMEATAVTLAVFIQRWIAIEPDIRKCRGKKQESNNALGEVDSTYIVSSRLRRRMRLDAL